MILLIPLILEGRSIADNSLDTGWEYSWEGKNGPWVTYPDPLISLKNERTYLWLRHKISQYHNFSNPGIDIRIKTFFEAFIGNEKIYDYSNQWQIKNLRGGVRHLFQLKSIEKSSYIYLKVASGGNQVGLEGVVRVDEYPTLVKFAIARDTTRLALGLLFCTFSILLLATFIMTKEVMLLYISGFGLNMGIWTMSFCHRITQEIIFYDPSFFDTAIYWSSYLAPIFILWFMSNLKSIWFRNALILTRNIFIIFSILTIAGSLLSLFTLRSANFIFNLLLIPTGLLILFATIISSFKGDKESRTILIGIIFVGAYTLVDSLSYTGLISQQYRAETPQGHWGMFAIYFSLIIIWLRSYQRSQKELQESRKYRDISELSRLLAHDIRRPFSKIKSFLEIIKPTIKEDKVYKMYSALEKEISKDTSSVESMLEDIMQFRSDNYHEKSNIPVSSIVFDSLIESVKYVPKRGIDIQINIKDHLFVKVYAPEIKRVFSNIFTNALEAMNNGDLIKVNASENSERIAIEISNTGSTISQEDLEHIFDPSFSKRHGGHGIGLSIAHKFISKHDGKIKCHSSENRVSFIFDLPKGLGGKSFDPHLEWPENTDGIINMPQEELDSVSKTENEIFQKALSALNIITHRFKILILEDEKFYQDYLSTLLEDTLDRGVQVIYCKDENDFKNSIRGTNLIICDVDLGLPKDGIEILRDTTLLSKPYICIHSQRWEKKDLRRALEAGANEVLAKPMTKSHLYGLIVKALDE